MGEATLVTASSVVHALDYGQFTIAGGTAQTDELMLLGESQDRPPSASDGSTVLVLSPHQNNFAMNIAIELWSDRPPHDEDEWDQVSVERVAVGAQAVRLGSPTLDDTACPMTPGDHWVEVSGRGFVNYGWPGSTEPRDAWRLRFWPASGPSEEVRKVWRMPGYGTPWARDA